MQCNSLEVLDKVLSQVAQLFSILDAHNKGRERVKEMEHMKNATRWLGGAEVSISQAVVYNCRAQGILSATDHLGTAYFSRALPIMSLTLVKKLHSMSNKYIYLRLYKVSYVARKCDSPCLYSSITEYDPSHPNNNSTQRCNSPASCKIDEMPHSINGTKTQCLLKQLKVIHTMQGKCQHQKEDNYYCTNVKDLCTTNLNSSLMDK